MKQTSEVLSRWVVPKLASSLEQLDRRLHHALRKKKKKKRRGQRLAVSRGVLRSGVLTLAGVRSHTK
jgi:hypothetical protein